MEQDCKNATACGSVAFSILEADRMNGTPPWSMVPSRGGVAFSILEADRMNGTRAGR